MAERKPPILLNHPSSYIWYLLIFVKVLRPGDCEVIFRSSSQAATFYYQSNHSKADTIPLSALLKDTSEFASWFSTHSLHCWTSSREAVNTNVLSILVRLDEGIERSTTDYEANAITTRPRTRLNLVLDKKKTETITFKPWIK